jgi:TetR/AcrR family transcriptional regulator, transcriptional repressor for nem operon
LRYDKSHKVETRRRVVEAAGRRFRRNGIEATGVAELMADAGLTHGGFYGHFPSKEALVEEAVAECVERNYQLFAGRVAQARKEGLDPIEVVLHAYFSTVYRDLVEDGCTYAALAQEIARHPPKTREGFSEGVTRMFTLVAGLLPQSWSEDRRQQTATAMFSMAVGALQLARAVHDPKVSEQILEAGLSSALALARG